MAGDILLLAQGGSAYRFSLSRHRTGSSWVCRLGKAGWPYDKRIVATDTLEMARSLGYDHALVGGHDIGGRVAYRLTLDHPQFVTDLISLAGRYSPLGEDRLFSKEQSRERWYFFFHQIAEFPEKLVSGKESIYLEHFYNHWSYCADWLSEEDLAEYPCLFHSGVLAWGLQPLPQR
jgi:pimeloyl-ACP methyl ester carboxylesterase